MLKAALARFLQDRWRTHPINQVVLEPEAIKEGDEMKRLLYVLVVSIITLPPAVRSQTPIVPDSKNTGPTSVTAQSGSQPTKTFDDCACESQALPEALAIVNDVRITRHDIARATKDSVSQLQRQVIEGRKRELDLLINSRLLTIEAKRRGIGTKLSTIRTKRVSRATSKTSGMMSSATCWISDSDSRRSDLPMSSA
jgi:hypothetical protein